MRRSLWVYRLLLKLYPAQFREEYGGPLQRQFKDDYAEVRTRRDVVRLWFFTLIDFLRSMPGQVSREVQQDARHCFRLWKRRPVHTAIIVGILAVSIGATTGVFSVLNALVLRALPFPEADRIATLKNFGPPRDGFHDWHQHSPYLADAATYDTYDVNVQGTGAVHRLRLAETSWNLLSMLGREPQLGRGFSAGEDVPGRDRVAILGYSAWRDLFSGDPNAVGSPLRINGTVFTVVGIAPRDLDFPQRSDLWTPTTFDVQLIPKTESVVFWTTIGRLKPELTWTQARAAFETEASQRDPQRRNLDAANRAALIPLQDQVAGPAKRASVILMYAVVLLLLVACANVANLLLARTVARSNELRIRAALGASRARIGQQLVTEALMLTGVATVAGLAIGAWVTQVATLAQPPQLRAQSYTVMDPRVLGFAIGVSALTALTFIIGPVAYASREALTVTRAATPPTRDTRTRAILTVLQVGVAIVLVTGSVGLGRAFLQLLHADGGYDIDSIVTMNVSLAGTRYENASDTRSYYDRVMEQVRRVPGVVAVSGTQSTPLNTFGFPGGRFNIDNAGPLTLVPVVNVEPRFFATMGARMIAGRDFTDEDRTSSERMAVINDAFASAYGAPDSLLNRYVTTSRWPRLRIVGVVRRLRYGQELDPGPQIFTLAREPHALTIVARLGVDAGGKIGALRQAAQAVDPNVPIFEIKTLDQLLDSVLARPRFYTTVLVFFGGLSLLLALAGVYGVVSYSTAQRTREMGVRLALGATPQRLRRGLCGRTGLMILASAVAGTAIALAAGKYLAALVRGAEQRTLGTSIVASGITICIAALASWSATRQIARLDVAEILRVDAMD